MKKRVQKKKIFVLGACALLIGGVLIGVLSVGDKAETANTPKVTVLMSTYNRGTTLGPSVESILAQTYEDFEFIIVNDGSTDNTAVVLESFAKRDPRVRVLTNLKNKGLVYGLNRGIDAARGEYIVRMDDDDYSLPFRLERQVAAMDAHPEIVVMGGGTIAPETTVSSIAKKETAPTVMDSNLIAMNTYFGPGVAHPTVVIRKDFLNKHNLRYRDDYLYAEDVGLWKDILNAGGKMSSIEEPVMFYRAIKLLPQPRAKDYGKTQQQSWRKVQKEKFERFFPITTEEQLATDEPVGRCKVLKKMRAVNQTKNIMDQKYLETYFTGNCTENLDDALVVKHPYWEGIVSVTPTRFERVGGDGGKIIKRSGDTVTVKWDKWDTEVYKKTSGGYEYVKDADGTVKTKN